MVSHPYCSTVPSDLDTGSLVQCFLKFKEFEDHIRDLRVGDALKGLHESISEEPANPYDLQATYLLKSNRFLGQIFNTTY